MTYSRPEPLFLANPPGMNPVISTSWLKLRLILGLGPGGAHHTAGVKLPKNRGGKVLKERVAVILSGDSRVVFLEIIWTLDIGHSAFYMCTSGYQPCIYNSTQGSHMCCL